MSILPFTSRDTTDTSDFQARSHNEERYGPLPEDMAIQDWGVSYDDLEPHFLQFEYLCGVAGQAGNINGAIKAGGNPSEGRRSRPYPTPPMNRVYGPTLFADAARELGYSPFPYWALMDNGLDVDIASIRGGMPPADPSSDDADNRPDDVRRFMEDAKAMDSLKNSTPVDAVKPEGYVIAYLPGGHGTMWDLAQSDSLARLLAAIYEQGKIIGAVCHGPSGLTDVKLSDGRYLVNGKHVNGFTNSEEQRAGLADVVPFLLETRLEERGARFVKNSSDFEPYAVRDGRLVTGQNPASSRMVGHLMLEALQELQSSTSR